jgi:diacylglycerol kinase (ATP)
VFPALDLVVSEKPGDLRRRAAEIARRGEPALVLAAGGDGTSHEVLNGLIDAGTDHPVSLGWLPIGSGNDLARSNGVPLGRPDCVDAYRTRAPARIDVGMIRFGTAGGGETRRAFGNSFTVGLSVDVLDRVARTGKRLGGRLSYALAALASIAAQRPRPIAARVDGEAAELGECRLLSVTNGRSFGAGMRIAPAAGLDDGVLDLVWLRWLSPLRTLILFPRIYWGGHLDHPAVSHRAIRRLELSGRDPIAFEADGERVEGTLPLEITLLPDGLGVIRPVPPGPKTRE